MENRSAVTSFIFMAYTELEDHRYLFFICFLLLYVLILLGNCVLILTVFIERGLHEPMYLFICNLAVNGLFGSTALLPSMLVLLLSHNYEISLTHCLLQVYCLYSYGAVEFTILAVMAYDRYVAICHPLHYHLLMSPRNIFAAISLSWVVPCIYIALYFIFTAQRSFCGRIIEKLYCSISPLVKLSCSDTTVQHFVGLGLIFISPTSQIIIILFSYAQVLRICLSGSKESQIKAIQTCTPHLATVINYSVGVLFKLTHNYSQFNMSNITYKAHLFMSLYFLIIPPLFNPVIYGICIQAIRVNIYKLLICKEKVNDLLSVLK